MGNGLAIDRLTWLRDVEFHAGQLIRCLEGLARSDRGIKRPAWQQSAALTRRVRGLARQELDDARRREKALAR